MVEEYTKEQLWKMLSRLPEELKEAMFSEKTADDIIGICKKNQVPKEEISHVMKLIGDVMLGILPLENLRNVLAETLNMKKNQVEDISFQIERIIFFPIRKELNEIYKKGGRKEKTILEKKHKLDKKAKKDFYREEIE